MNQATLVAYGGIPTGAFAANEFSVVGGIIIVALGVLPLLVREWRIAYLGALEVKERKAALASGNIQAHRDLCQRAHQTRDLPP